MAATDQLRKQPGGCFAMASFDVSACLIVKDAQGTLPRCLESIVDLVKELIVVDTGSTDATKSQAEASGCRVYTIHPTDILIHHSGYDDRQTDRRKLERNARLLQLDLRQRPDDAYVLMNLGTAYAELGRVAEAVPLLRQSLRLSPPNYSTIR